MQSSQYWGVQALPNIRLTPRRPIQHARFERNDHVAADNRNRLGFAQASANVRLVANGPRPGGLKKLLYISL